MKRGEKEDDLISGPDHLPICTQYRFYAENHHKQHIPGWTTKTKVFAEEFERLWGSRPHTCDAFKEADYLNELL